MVQADSLLSKDLRESLLRARGSKFAFLYTSDLGIAATSHQNKLKARESMQIAAWWAKDVEVG